MKSGINKTPSNLELAVFRMVKHYAVYLDKQLKDEVEEFVGTGVQYSADEYATLFYLVYGELVGTKVTPTIFYRKHVDVIKALTKELKTFLFKEGHYREILEKKQVVLIMSRVHLNKALRYSEERKEACTF